VPVTALVGKGDRLGKSWDGSSSQTTVGFEHLILSLDPGYSFLRLSERGESSRECRVKHWVKSSNVLNVVKGTQALSLCQEHMFEHLSMNEHNTLVVIHGSEPLSGPPPVWSLWVIVAQTAKQLAQIATAIESLRFCAPAPADEEERAALTIQTRIRAARALQQRRAALIDISLDGFPESLTHSTGGNEVHRLRLTFGRGQPPDHLDVPSPNLSQADIDKITQDAVAKYNLSVVDGCRIAAHLREAAAVRCLWHEVPSMAPLADAIFNEKDDDQTTEAAAQSVSVGSLESLRRELASCGRRHERDACPLTSILASTLLMGVDIELALASLQSKFPCDLPPIGDDDDDPDETHHTAISQPAAGHAMGTHLVSGAAGAITSSAWVSSAVGRPPEDGATHALLIAAPSPAKLQAGTGAIVSGDRDGDGDGESSVSDEDDGEEDEWGEDIFDDDYYDDDDDDDDDMESDEAHEMLEDMQDPCRACDPGCVIV